MSEAKQIDFHGWNKSVIGAAKLPSLHVGRLPNRKGIALYEANGHCRILAYFRDEASAARTIELIDHLTGLGKKS